MLIIRAQALLILFAHTLSTGSSFTWLTVEDWLIPIGDYNQTSRPGVRLFPPGEQKSMILKVAEPESLATVFEILQVEA